MKFLSVIVLLFSVLSAFNAEGTLLFENGRFPMTGTLSTYAYEEGESEKFSGNPEDFFMIIQPSYRKNSKVDFGSSLLSLFSSKLDAKV